ncbi:MAG: M42 family metallopeptidase [Clostridiales bacterium]|nr:M42 family metallopeptidase [Clostridiales bacterium]
MNTEHFHDLNLIEKLSNTFGPSGCEDSVAGLILSQISGFCDEVTTDKLGNIIAVIRGKGSQRQKLMLAAHMDEVGFMISYIEDDGTLKFNTVGGMDPRVLCGRRVHILNSSRIIPGIIAAKPIHLQKKEERKEVTPIEKMYIDIGASTREEAATLCSPGDYATFDSEFVIFGENLQRIKGKALDDRMGCALLIEVMREIYDENLPDNLDLYFAFTVREEVGLSGAVTAAYAISPDYCIVLESTAVADIDGVPESKRVARLGEGGALSLIDNGTIYHRDFFDFALKCAKEMNIKCQIKQYISGGNDGAHIHKSKSGIKTIALSAPTRYLHSSCCVADINDYRTMRQLTQALIAKMPF